jgi:hypothetical protein
MTQHIVLDIDGQQHAVDADPDMPLLYALRDHLQFDNPPFRLRSSPSSRIRMPPALFSCGRRTVSI